MITFNKVDLQNRRLGGVFNFGDTVDGVYLPIGSLQRKSSINKSSVASVSYSRKRWEKPHFQILLTAIEEESIGGISADVLESIRD